MGVTTTPLYPGIAERWNQARLRNLLARAFGRPQLARRDRLRDQRAAALIAAYASVEQTVDGPFGRFSVGDLVRIRPGGVSIFQVIAILDDEDVLVVAVAHAPGRYPYLMRATALVPADAEPAASSGSRDESSLTE